MLVYDATCGFCAASVRFVLRRDRQRTLRFAPLQGEFGRAVLARHPELVGIDSMLWLSPAVGGGEVVSIRSDAALAAAAHLGGMWRLAAAAARLVPRAPRDRAYRLIARHRHRLPGAGEACYVPSAEDRGRFLD